jgi:cell division protein FtsB
MSEAKARRTPWPQSQLAAWGGRDQYLVYHRALDSSQNLWRPSGIAPMVTWFEAVISPLKAAAETAKKAVEIRDEIKIQELKTVLHRQISDAYNAAFAFQQRESALREENEKLKHEIVELKAFEARKARYQLQTIPPGIVVCALKPGAQTGSDPEYACQTCCENGQINALHRSNPQNGIQIWTCNGCDAKLRSGTFQRPEQSGRRSPFHRYRG